MNGLNKELCLESASHWDVLASEAESFAEYDRNNGIDMSPPGQSPGDYRARQFRRCADALRLELETGKEHCHCHMKPRVDCPYGGAGVRS